MRLEKKVAWISGANKGIGEGTARLFAREGARVVMIGRTQSEGEAIVKEIKEQGGEAYFIRCDVTRPEEIRMSIENTVQMYGGLDILVNNAGTVGLKMLHECTIEEWDYLFDLNVKSMFLAFKYAFPYLTENPKSYVVNVGSISTFVGQDSTPIYTTTKGAVLQLSRSIGIDYARYGIRCNCVCPGITETPLLHTHLNASADPDAALKRRLNRVPIRRALTPEDVAKAILYFSCEDSAGITATSLIVDGGYLAVAEWDAAKYDVDCIHEW
jgi:NAD(P)-dependent dehydrogenase (short-subunit alcohol dehydrogenase family)